MLEIKSIYGLSIDDAKRQLRPIKAAKRRSPSVRQKEAEAKTAKREDETDKEREDRRLQDAQAKPAK